MTWAKRADAVIRQVDDQLPRDADLATRKRELRKVAALFHGGTSWGRKVWSLRARAYLERHGLPPRPRNPLSSGRKTQRALRDEWELSKALALGDISFPFRDRQA